MRYVRAKMRQEYQTKVYRAYVGEAMKNLSRNVAEGFGRQGAAYMSKSYLDILDPDTGKEPTKTASEIINSMKEKLKGKE